MADAAHSFIVMKVVKVHIYCTANQWLYTAYIEPAAFIEN